MEKQDQRKYIDENRHINHPQHGTWVLDIRLNKLVNVTTTSLFVTGYFMLLQG